MTTNTNIADQIKTLQLFWTNYIQATNETIKLEWLELFLFAYNSLLYCPEFNPNRYRFLSLVPSQLSCYLLQLVYAIIRASILPDNRNNLNQSRIISSNDSERFIHESAEGRHPIETEDPNSDLTAIEALRDFLIQGTGGRIIELLQIVDTQDMLCARELSGLLVNLFPTHPWNTDCNMDLKNPVEDLPCLADSINLLEAHKTYRPSKLISNKTIMGTIFCRFRKHFEANDLPNHTIYNQLENSKHCDDLAEYRIPSDYKTDQSERFRIDKLSTDYVGSIIINLLGKLAAEENLLTIDRCSVTVQCLNFSVDNFCSISNQRSNPLTFDDQSRERLKRKLLWLLSFCMNRMYTSCKKDSDLFDLTNCYERLLKSLQIECDFNLKELLIENVITLKLNHMMELLYCLMLILQITMQPISLYSNDMYKSLISILLKYEVTIQETLTIISQHIEQFNEIAQRFLSIVFKIISNLRSLEEENLNQERNRKIRNKKRKSISSSISTMHHRDEINQIDCIFDRLLFKSIQYLPCAHQRSVFVFCQKYNLCCCSFDSEAIDSLKSILKNSLQNKLYKFGLRFIQLNVIRIIYTPNIECMKCDRWKLSSEFDSQLIETYKDWLNKSAMTDLESELLFLKHIAKISKYLPYDLSCMILSDIILPKFRLAKEQFIDSVGQPVAEEIIICCLHIFLCYLKDVRLIKGFFNLENMQHLIDLFVYPTFASVVSNIIKIGLDNSSYLGEDGGEQKILYVQLKSIVIESIKCITDILSILFYDVFVWRHVNEDTKFNVDPLTSLLDKDPNQQDNKILQLYNGEKLSLYNILQLAVVYWNLILQLLRSNAQFKHHIHNEIFMQPHQQQLSQQNSVFPVIYNSLKCVLLLGEQPTINKFVKDTDKLLSGDNYHWMIGNIGDNSIINLLENGSAIKRSIFRNCEPIDSYESNRIYNLKFNGSEYCWICDKNSNVSNGFINKCDDDLTLYCDSRLIENDKYDLLNRQGFIETEYNQTDRHSYMNAIEGNHKSETAVLYVYNVNNSSVNNINNYVDGIICTFCEHKRTHSTFTINCNYCVIAASFYQHLNTINPSDRDETIQSNSDKNVGVSEKNALSLAGDKNNLNVIEDEKRNPNTDNEYTYFSYGVQKLNEIIRNNLTFPSIFFGPPTDKCDATNLCMEDNVQVFNHTELSELCKSEYRKLLMQIFEITCGIMMSDVRAGGKIEPYMRSALQQLKALLLRHTETIMVSVENGTTIINALQSLLKVAEMRNKCCLIDDCTHPGSDQLIQTETSQSQLKSSKDDVQLVKHVDTNINNAQVPSDLEQSDDDDEDAPISDDSFRTADEGYDADAEIGNCAETDMEDTIDILKPTQLPPVSRYRNNIVYEGICRIVIDILITLSRRCLTDPQFWPNYLMQIASRLCAIKQSIGGSLYLIRGFAPVLSSNDTRLRDFQKSILELITSVDTPETFMAYLKLMTNDTAPIDLLLPRLIYLTGFSNQMQPSCDIEFPTVNDGVLVSTCDPLILKDFKQIHDYHEYHNIKSAFTQSTYVAPLNYTSFRPWNPNGFTITTWIQLNPQDFDNISLNTSMGSGSGHSSSRGHQCSNSNCLWSDDRSHLLSIGSDKLLLSVYLSQRDNGTMFFQLTNPSAQIAQRKQKTGKPMISRSSTDYVNLMGEGNKKNPLVDMCPCSDQFKQPAKTFSTSKNVVVPIHEEIILDDRSDKSIKILNLTREKEHTEAAGINVLSTTKEAIKTTRIAIRNSLSQFNLFSMTGSSSSDTEFFSLRYPVQVKGLQIQRNKWTHLCFSICPTSGKEISIRITIDGCIQHEIHLPSNVNVRNEKLQLLCLGDKAADMNNSISKSRTTINDQCVPDSLKYNLSNVMIFRKSFDDIALISTLMALGPDSSSLQQCKIGNRIPNYGLFNTNKSLTTISLKCEHYLQLLHQNVAAIYSASDPNVIIGFNVNTDGLGVGERLGLIRLGCGATPRYIPSFQTTVYMCGGLSTLLMLFAKVVELSSSEYIQSSALALLLRIAYSNSLLYSEFIQNDYMSLIAPIIRSSRCHKTIYLLKAILDTACDVPVLTKRCDQFLPIIHTNACILYPDLLISIINHYSDWTDPRCKESSILEMLFQILQAIVREKHPFQSVNVSRLMQANLVPSLLQFCKIYLVDGAPQTVYLSNRTADGLINLIRTFAGAPPAPTLLDDIVKVLLLLHRPSDSFITHDRSKFYYLLTPTVCVKSKRISLPLPTRRLSLSMKRERKRTAPSRTTINYGRYIRSVSLERPQNESENKENNLNLNENHSGEDFVDHVETSLHTQIPESNLKTENNQKENVSTTSSKEPFNVVLEAIKSHVNIDQRTASIFSSSESIQKIDRKTLTNGVRHNVRQSPLASSRKRSIKRNRQYSQHMRHKLRPPPSQSATTDSEAEPQQRRRSSQAYNSVSESGFDEDMTLVRDYDIISPIENLSINGNQIGNVDDVDRRSNITLNYQRTDDEGRSTGVVQVQNGFLRLLRDFVLILPDNVIQEVLTCYVTMDIILVLASHRDPSVRASIVRLLAVMCDRWSSTTIAQYKRANYWHHLANQVSLNVANYDLIEACSHWITGSCLPLNEIVLEANVTAVHPCGFNALFAVLSHSLLDVHLIRLTCLLIDKIFDNSIWDIRQGMIDNGLLTTGIKCLVRFYSKWGTGQEQCLDSLHQMFCSIGRASLKSTGTIHVLWDMLNGLTFVEQNRNGITLRGIRATHAHILDHLLQAFFPDNRDLVDLRFRFNVSEIDLIQSQLSSAEKKARFDLLTDHAVKFITNVAPSHIPTDSEIHLIQKFVSIVITGYQKCGHIIPWTLCPSRPLQLKLFVCRLLWHHSRSGQLPTLPCDGKLVKTMAQSFLMSDREIIPSYDLDYVIKICTALGPMQNTAWNLSQALEKMEFAREYSCREQNPAIERTIFKFETITQNCIESAMKITRNVVELQNTERGILMHQMRAYDENELTEEWKLIIDRMTHEGAPWHYANGYPNSWELNQTEGPGHVRIRMQRCKLDIADKFLLPEAPSRKRVYAPLSYLRLSFVQRPNFSLNDQVLYTFLCRQIAIDAEIKGEIILTESHLIFVPNDLEKDPIRLEITTITEIWPRRYQHQSTALDFVLETNISVFFVFDTETDCDILIKFFADKVVNGAEIGRLQMLTQQWKEGQLTNWDYLMGLNQISGRTYQDLMQYVVFPWIIAKYDTNTIDLSKEQTYRKLDKPIAIQYAENEIHYIRNYEYLSQPLPNSSNTNHMAAYHYGSHFSNSGIVLHFLVRIPPFTRFFLTYQDNNFDIPDRTFHSVQTTWRLASKDSHTDVKELIPEFFCLPELFENMECFNFGHRQSGELVNNVALPPWANGSARLFTLIHRQALESDFVRKNLHKWIDLIFGYKQTGQPAVEAINVFHPATYIGFSVNGIDDPVVRMAMETMIRTYGQMPKQLFKTPHPEAIFPQPLRTNSINKRSQHLNILSTVFGLKWGHFTGSPALTEPTASKIYRQNEIRFSYLISMLGTNVIYGLPYGYNLIQGNDTDTMNLISWSDADGIVRVKTLHDDSQPAQPLLHNHSIDPITVCGTSPSVGQLWFGHRSGRITIYQCINEYSNKYQHKTRSFESQLSYNSATFRKISSKSSSGNNLGLNIFQKLNVDSEPLAMGSSTVHRTDDGSMRWKGPIVLIRHTDEITGIELCPEFRIVVSISQDGLAVIWDMNRLQYVRTIDKLSTTVHTAISLLTISPTLGDIATVHIPSICHNHSIEHSNDMDIMDGEEAIENNLDSTEDDFVSVPFDLTDKTLLRVHTINGKYVSHVIIDEKILCCGYSSMKEGTGVNVIATSIRGGIIRLWSSWDLTLIREFSMDDRINIIALTYSTYQHLVLLREDNTIQVWESPGLPGCTPKFPQILFNKWNNFLE